MPAPTVSIAVADDTLTVGQTSLVTFTFSEAVVGFTNADVVSPHGELSVIQPIDGGVTWTAILTPTVETTALGNTIRLDTVGVTSLGGAPGTELATSNSYDVATVRPTATVAVDEPVLTSGYSATVTITFSEEVTGFSVADLTVPHGTLSSLGTVDGLTWTATLTPDAGTEAAGDVITLHNTGYTTLGGSAGEGETTSNSYAVDTQAPTATIVLDDTDLSAGETTTVTITFSEEVGGFANASLTAPNGVLSSVTTNDDIIFTATFTPTASLADATNVITLHNAGAVDMAGNSVEGATASDNFAIDTTDGGPALNFSSADGGDVMHGNAQDNMMTAGSGDDSVAGADGDDTVGGAAGADILQGNTGADSLSGGDGGDTVLGGQGDDVVQGDAGGDWVSGDKGSDIALGGSGEDTVLGGQGDDYVSGDAGDDLTGGDAGDDSVTGGQGDDIVYGNTGDDLVFGDKGADTVRGGQGADNVAGGDGDDWLSGDRGSDTVTGGAGADVFHTWGGAGLDVVTDFSVAQGDRVQLDPGTIYAVAQVGDDTVIDMQGGGQMILAGVQLSTLPDGWIFLA